MVAVWKKKYREGMALAILETYYNPHDITSEILHFAKIASALLIHFEMSKYYLHNDCVCSFHKTR